MISEMKNTEKPTPTWFPISVYLGPNCGLGFCVRVSRLGRLYHGEINHYWVEPILMNIFCLFSMLYFLLRFAFPWFVCVYLFGLVFAFVFVFVVFVFVLVPFHPASTTMPSAVWNPLLPMHPGRTASYREFEIAFMDAATWCNTQHTCLYQLHSCKLHRVWVLSFCLWRLWLLSSAVKRQKNAPSPLIFVFPCPRSEALRISVRSCNSTVRMPDSHPITFPTLKTSRIFVFTLIATCDCVQCFQQDSWCWPTS